jgi:hypothetical protein
MEPISAAAREMMITPISERVIPASLFPAATDLGAAPTGVRFPPTERDGQKTLWFDHWTRPFDGRAVTKKSAPEFLLAAVFYSPELIDYTGLRVHTCLLLIAAFTPAHPIDFSP